MEETLVVFEHVLLQVFPKTHARELQQVASSVLQFQEVWFQQRQTVLSLSLCGEPFGNCCNRLGPIVLLHSFGTE